MAGLTRRRGLAMVGAGLALAGLLTTGCGEQTRTHRPPEVIEGDAEVGRSLIADYGCGSCHRIPGVRGADGLVGPPLDDMGERSFIAGELLNNQANMIRWVTDPQGVEPGTAMPDLGVTEAEATHISAYLAGL